MKKVHFIAGLPRSGSTLLCNILSQNPKFHATATSGLVDCVVNTRDMFDENPAFKAMDEEENKKRRKGAIKGLIDGYFDGIDAEVCFDKNRGWAAHMELLSWLYGKENVKVILCLRDMREILASFEVLHRKTLEDGSSTSQNRQAPGASSTALGRAQILANGDNVVGNARDIVVDAAERGWGPNLYCLDYEHLCAAPDKVMESLYEFLGEDLYEHDFDNVEAVTVEDDRVHGFKDLHTIRPKVEPQPHKWQTVFGNPTISSDFWKQLEQNCVFWRPKAQPDENGESKETEAAE